MITAIQNVDMTNHTIKNLADPVENGDAVNLKTLNDRVPEEPNEEYFSRAWTLLYEKN